MKASVRQSVTALLAILVFALIHVEAAHAAVGRTAGTFAVSPTGAATYSIPIWAPPGPQGLQPQIALVYSSQGGNGSEGVGWSVAGLSSIYRCNQTVAQDAAAAPVAAAYGDRFCLDGKRLRITNDNLPSYGQDNTVYQTEVADFSNVTAHSIAGGGPAYFTVQGRNGWSYEYGHTTDSQVLNASGTVLDWMLDKVTDRAGNTMQVKWEPTSSNLSGTTIPASISWTPISSGSSDYTYTMLFTYQALLNAVQAGYIAGQPLQNFYGLSNIQIQYSSAGVAPYTTIKAYMLGYSVSPTTQQETLTTLTECTDTTQSSCLQPTALAYQPGQAGIQSSPTSISGSSGVVSFAFDLNGDGINDLVYYDTGSGSVKVAFGSASGYSAPRNTPITTSSVSVGYIDGTSTASILVAQGGAYVYYKWNGSSFASNPTGVNTVATGSPIAFPLLTDANGDGLPDLIYTNASGEMFVLPNTTASGVVQFGTPIDAGSVNNIVPGSTVNSITSQLPGTGKFDFTGDGQADLLGFFTITTPLGPQYVQAGLHFTGSSFTLAGVGWGGPNSPGSLVDVGDYNDDGCMDLLYVTEVVLATCAGNSGTILTFAPDHAIAGINWDGGSRRAVLVNRSGQIGLYKSLGNTLGPFTPTTLSYNSAETYTAVPNPTGDGLDGLAMFGSGVQYYLHNGAGQPPDLLSSATDGYGNSAKPTYVSIAQSNYTIGTSTPQSGFQNYVGPLYVVNQSTFSDPSSATGGTYQQTFTYSTAWMNLQGRGFNGFLYYQQHDSRTGAYEQFGFNLGFPKGGMFAWDQPSFDQAANQPIRFTFANSVATTLDSTAHNQRYFDYFNSLTSQEYQVSWSQSLGSSPGPLIKTTSTSYQYGSDNYNYGSPTQITATVTDNDSSSPYNNQSWTTTTTNTTDVNTSTWCLTLSTQVQVVYSDSLSSLDTVTRTTSYPTPDTINCRYTQIVTEPSNSSFKVTETLAYDLFGNVNSDIVTGINMAARLTTANWGATGQFPTTFVDPLGNALGSSGYQTVNSFDYSKGLLTSQVVQSVSGSVNNAPPTTWQYDGFGRKTQENRPDGAFTIWSYNDCASSGGCLIGSHALALTQTVYNTNATVQTDGTTYFDPVDRPLVSTQRLLANGSYARNEVRYDSLGRVGQRAMPCTWSGLSTECPYLTTNSYDLLNRLTQTQRPISAINGSPQSTTYQYSGRTTIVTDPYNNTKTMVTDVNGWLRKTEDAYNYTVTLGYDAAGSKTTAIDSLNNHLWSGTYGYGMGAFLTSESDMDRGTWTYSPDALGEVTGWWDAKSPQPPANPPAFTMTYDPLSRPQTRTEPDYFTQWTWGSSASSHNIGQLQQVCTGTGTKPTSCSSAGYSEAEAYDSLARPYQRAITIPSTGTFTYSQLYNSTTGFPDTLTYPASTGSTPFQIQYGYQNGVLQSITDISDPTHVTVWQANAEDAAGHVTQETLGNGIVTNRSYDAVTHWLTSMQAGAGGGSGIKNLSFLYDEMGNLTLRQDGTGTLNLNENIYYDKDYRLSTTKLGTTQTLAVTYDLTGNITSRSDIAGGATWTYDSVHKHAVVQIGSIPPQAFQASYDSNGNMSFRQGFQFSWSSYNYPTQLSNSNYQPGNSYNESVSLAYSPDRRRWYQMYQYNGGLSGTTETTDYIGGLFELVVTPGVNDYRHYIYAGNEPVAVYSRKSNGNGGTFSYLVADHEGSVAAITNSSGAVVVSESFDPYGTRRNPTTWSGPASSPDLTASAGVTRQAYDFQTTLGVSMGNHLNGRVEDFFIGRMESADPTIPDPTDAQSYNRYTYVNNNPLTYVDPSGFDSCVALSSTSGELYQEDCDTPATPLPAFLPALWPDQPLPAPPPFDPSKIPLPPIHVTTETPKTPPPRNVLQLPPCKTFAEDMAARKAIANQNAAEVAAASSINDFLGITAEVSGSLSKALGQSAAGAEALGKATTVVGIVFTANDTFAAITTHDPQRTFDASYGGASLIATGIDPMFGVGMAMASLVDKLMPPPPTQFEQELGDTGPKCIPQ